MVALRAAAARLGTWRLDGCTLAVTLEPCPMCAGAVWLSRVDRLVFGAWNADYGAAGSLWDVVRDRRLNHRPEVVAGVLAEECSDLLAQFFSARRRPALTPAIGVRRFRSPGAAPCTLLGGGVSERPKEHASKACEVKASVGSNPTATASHDRSPGACPGGSVVREVGDGRRR